MNIDDKNAENLDKNLQHLASLDIIELGKISELTYYFDTEETITYFGHRVQPPEEHEFDKVDLNLVRLVETELKFILFPEVKNELHISVTEISNFLEMQKQIEKYILPLRRESTAELVSKINETREQDPKKKLIKSELEHEIRMERSPVMAATQRRQLEEAGILDFDMQSHRELEIITPYSAIVLELSGKMISRNYELEYPRKRKYARYKDGIVVRYDLRG